MMSATNLSETVDLSALNLGQVTVRNLLTALISLVVCLIAIRMVVALLRRVLQKTKLEAKLQKYIITGVRAVMWLIGILIIVDALGIPITSLVALLSVFTLTISLAVQTILSNVASGMILLSNKPFRVGDYVETAGGCGYIRDMHLTVTVLETRDGCRITIPNGVLSGGTISNFDAMGRRRITVMVTASYDAPLATVKEALQEAAGATDKILANPEPAVTVSNYGESSIEYGVYCWCLPEDYWTVLPALTEKIKYAFDAHGIEMTYNHLNVHILDRG